MNNKGFISKYGLLSTIVVTVTGVGVFAYPNLMANEIGTDGWFVAILSGGVVFLFLSLIYKVIIKNNYQTFYNILEDNLGKAMSKIFGIIFCIHFIFSISLGMRIFTEVIKMYLLERTPTEFIILVMIFTGIYLVRGEIPALIKFNEIAFPAMFIPIAITLIFSIKGGKATNLLPVLQHKPDDYLRALVDSTFAFGGFEIAYMVLPYMKDKDGIRKTFFKSISIITIFYAIVTILCIMFFSKEHTKELLWPTITLIRAINMPGAFIERWEGVVMALWVLFYFTTFVNMYYFSGDIIKNIFNLHDIKLSSIILAPIVYIIALYPQNIAEVYDVSKKINSVLSVFSFLILPLILLFFGRAKERGKNKSET